jgi:Ca2+-binding RTX toxin-like protein
MNRRTKRQKKHTTPRKRNKNFRKWGLPTPAAVEILEERRLLSAVTAVFEAEAVQEVFPCEGHNAATLSIDQNGVVAFGGTDNNDYMKVEEAAGFVVFSVDGQILGGFASSLVTHINVDAYCGNDLVEITQSVGQTTDLDGGHGNDILLAGSGSSTMFGGTGSDIIIGSANDDVIFGGLHKDVIFANGGNDQVFGQHGADVVVGGSGHDRLDGGGQNDILIGDGPDAIPAVPADELDLKTYLTRIANIGAGHDYIEGGSGDDWVFSGKGNDLVLLGAGNDFLDAGAGNDGAAGGSGDDEMHLRGGNDIALGDGPNVLPGPTDVANDTLRSDFVATIQDYAAMNTGNDYMEGGMGADWLLGGNGHDLIFGGNGNDKIEGGRGNDILVGGNDNDTIIAGIGNDWGFGDGTNTLPATLPTRDNLRSYLIRFSNVNAGSDIMDMGAGNDLALGGKLNDIIGGGDGRDVLAGQGGKDALLGDAGDDLLLGGDWDDIMFGGAGNDVMVGGGGNDWVAGGAGDDLIHGLALRRWRQSVSRGCFRNAGSLFLVEVRLCRDGE